MSETQISPNARSRQRVETMPPMMSLCPPAEGHQLRAAAVSGTHMVGHGTASLVHGTLSLVWSCVLTLVLRLVSFPSQRSSSRMDWLTGYVDLRSWDHA